MSIWAKLFPPRKLYIRRACNRWESCYFTRGARQFGLCSKRLCEVKAWGEARGMVCEVVEGEVL